jgi:ferric-dicitrate binding protein FerR (iron transport regulator)
VRLDDWIKDDTAGSVDEAERLHPRLPPRVLEGIRHDSASTEDEVLALHRRLRRVPSTAPVPLGRRLFPWGAVAGAVMVGAAALALVVALPASTPDTPRDRSARMAGPAALELEDGQHHALTPDISVAGPAALTVERTDETGAWVQLEHGLAHFQVDPEGTARHLVVTAGDTTVTVKGTVFTVQRLRDRVTVEVTHGRVAVAHGGAETLVSAGEVWRSEDAPVAGSTQVAARVSVDRQPPEGRSPTSAAPTADEARAADPAPRSNEAPPPARAGSADGGRSGRAHV